MKKLICILAFVAGFYTVIGSSVLATGTSAVVSHNQALKAAIETK